MVDERDYKALRKWVKARLIKLVPSISFEDATSNKPQRIVTKDMTKLLLHITEEKKKEESRQPILQNETSTKDQILKKAAAILRDDTLEFIRGHNTEFNPNVSLEPSNEAPLLMQFMKRVLAGSEQMTQSLDSHISKLASTITSHITYNIKTERQVRYKSENESFIPRHTYTPEHHIGLGLSVRESDRNNQLLKLLSAPNYGLSMSVRQCQRYETMIANAVIDNMSQNDNVYIPSNLLRNIIPFYHLDNIDWIEDRPDGKGTSHLLQLTIFQKETMDSQPMELLLDTKTTSLTLKPNQFSELVPCKPPSKSQFIRTPGCTSFNREQIIAISSTTVRPWLTLKTLEYILILKQDISWNPDLNKEASNVSSNKVTTAACSSNSLNSIVSTLTQPSNESMASRKGVTTRSRKREMSSEIISTNTPVTSVKKRLFEPQAASVQHSAVCLPTCVTTEPENYIHSPPEATAECSPSYLSSQEATYNKSTPVPSYSATCSIVCSDIDTTKTKVFATPLINGPASDYAAILAGLLRANKVTTWSCGLSAKTVISLDLDLYEKCYMLVNSREDLRKRYILCLGELHIVFAHIRAIGRFIDYSGIGDAWIESGWYDSYCVVREILECSHMKRAVEAHEATLLAINILMLKPMMSDVIKCASLKDKKLVTIIEQIHNGLSQRDDTKVKKAFSEMQYVDSKIEELENVMKETRQNNRQYVFLRVYQRMVIRLLTFIEASRSRNWLLHLSSADDMMKDLISMDRIKYRRMMAAYIADMRRLETESPEIWQAFMDGQLSVQKGKGVFTAIGRDHAGEQVNKEQKTRGGLTGITHSENSRTKRILINPILESISQSMCQIGGVQQDKETRHHQLSPSYTTRQNKKINTLVATFESHGLDVNSADEPLSNIVTGQVFNEKISHDVLNCESIGATLYDQFVTYRLQENSTTSLFAPLKKASLQLFASANKKKTMKVNERIVELKGNCNLFAKCAILKDTRTIDMEVVIGQHELTVVPRSLMDPRGHLLPGGEGKSDLVKTVLRHTTASHTNMLPSYDCVAIDAMYLLNTITPKPAAIKTGRDLSDEFCRRIDNLSLNSSNVIVAFDNYDKEIDKMSLKTATRVIRNQQKKGKGKIPRYFEVREDTNISKVTMTELLGDSRTKKALTQLLSHAVIVHLQGRQVNYVVASGGRSHFYFGEGNEGLFDINHEEADTLIIYCLAISPLIALSVFVYSIDTDVFVLLLKHFEAINCKTLYMDHKSGTINLTEVWEKLSPTVASSLLGLHCFTGSDTTGKINGRSKQLWTQLFLKNTNNFMLMDRFANFSEMDIQTTLPDFAEFLCSGYMRKLPYQIDRSKLLSDCRYLLFVKKGSEGYQLPPTLGAFRYHVRRAQYQMSIWFHADKAILPENNPEDYGWNRDETFGFLPVTTDDLIAPVSVIELVSCISCQTGCNTKRCVCKRLGEACTDFCGCNKTQCENMDGACPRAEDETEMDIDEEDE